MQENKKIGEKKFFYHVLKELELNITGSVAAQQTTTFLIRCQNN